ncbi:MAG: hypothetical protein R2778_01550 [Saprospiraceae bacterium]
MILVISPDYVSRDARPIIDQKNQGTLREVEKLAIEDIEKEAIKRALNKYRCPQNCGKN